MIALNSIVKAGVEKLTVMVSVAAASSEELSGQAELLKEMVGKLKLKNNANMIEIKAPKLIANTKTSRVQAAAAKAPRRITLNENDFGKY